ncbi:ATP-binding cassette domain-containing protein, partial [uncultured Jatrophihabitans sp.]|uniref:ATP-binding cassette domain-containing protein n=1 Tax=uncultured Jatrophihabitans sp. TaxID=1610747 RepID=UPI0035CA6BF9
PRAFPPQQYGQPGSTASAPVVPPQYPAAQRPPQGAPAGPAQGPPPGTARPSPDNAGFNNQLSAVHELGSLAKGQITIGRTPDNRITVDDLLVSRHHAALTFDGRAWTLRDLGSSNGTFVDGRRITSAQIGPRNLISIGHKTFRLQSDGNLTEYQDTGAITFEAHQLTVQVGERRILDRVSFSLDPKNMLVIVGPSGSGKSTLLKALTGISPATYGGVGYGGRDLYTNYDEIRHRIGLVPQDDILHPQLKVREALLYAGQLRFPPDVDSANCARRVDQVIHELGLVPQAQQRVSTLSGGQRKRTSTAMELLTSPSLLFLDEPTSGLDINRDREVMQVLRRLADDGRTVVVISHNVTYLDLADKILVLATGGQLAYYGPPKGVLEFFGCSDWADMYAQLEQPRTDWYQRYINSPVGRQYGGLPSAGPVAGAGRAAAVAAAAPPPRQQSALAQFSTLSRRYLKVIASDKAFVGLTMITPLVLALFAHAVPGSSGLSALDALKHKTHSPVQLLLVLIIGGCLSGSAGAVREIVKERPIFSRERAIGLAWGPYLASKVVVLGVVSAVQAIVLGVFGLLTDPGPDDALLGSSGKLDMVIVLIFVTFSSMTLGLLLSTVVTNADRTMPLLVLIIMAQLLLSGGLFPVRGRAVLEQLSWLSPARWGYAAGASVSQITPSGGQDDPLWHHTGHTFAADLIMCVVLSAIYLVVTSLFLRRVGQVKAARPN